MKISVIICTYNRAILLDDSIKSIQGQDFTHNQFEIVIVDNNSTDNTKEICKKTAITSDVRIKYIFEPRQGLSFARNTGIEHAEGEIVLFTDDDIEADKSWLCEIVSVFDRPEVACAGGPIRPLWPFEKPSWINTDRLTEPLSISEFSAAKETGYFSGHYPFGANIAFHRETFKQFGAFSEGLGRQAGKLLSNEEIELCQRIEAAGKQIRFAPNAVIYHKIAPERMTKQWFYRRFYWQGRSDAVLDLKLQRNVYQLMKYRLDILNNFTNGKDDNSIESRCQYRSAKGYLHQLLLDDNAAIGKFDKQKALEIMFKHPNTHKEVVSTENAINMHRIREFENSYSWRLTAPLRKFSDRVRQIRKLF